MIGTDRHVYLFRGSNWSVTKVKELDRRFAVDEQPVDYNRDPSVLRIGDEKIWLGQYTDEDEKALDRLSRPQVS